MGKDQVKKVKDEEACELADYQVQVMDDLSKSGVLAGDLFDTPAPTPEMVFGVYDRVFDVANPDDEDEDEDEE